MRDFRNQNLRGHSFRGQDLSDADFSGADIRGADLSSANLTKAKFCGVRMGKTLSRRIGLFLASLAIGFAFGIVSFFGSYILMLSFGEIGALIFKNASAELYFDTLNFRVFIYSACLAYLLGLYISIEFSLKKQSWKTVLVYYFSIAAWVTVAGAVSESDMWLSTPVGSAAMAGMGTIAGMGALGGAVALAAAIMGVGTRVGAAAVLVSGAVIGAGAGLMGQLFSGGGVEWIQVAGAVLAVGLFLLVWYINYRSFKYEHPLLLPLRQLSLKFASWGGTNFENAVLVETDFSGADLTHTRFTGSKLIRCTFHHAKNLHLANTLNTPLEPLAVRQLLLDGRTTVRDFAYLNLRGITFAGLDLRGCNFHHADLSEADMRGCNLSDCDFTEAMALGTLLDNAIFTGAILDNWSVDKHTQFNGAHCRFVYLKRDKSEKNPQQGEFKDGDFAKLYQEIANTVDFIAHTPAELQALLRAIEKIKAEGGDIFIQQMERKADSVVLRVQSEGNVEPDKAAIYAEVQQEKEIELKAIKQEYEQKLLAQQHELEKEQIRREAKTEQVDLLAGLLHKTIDKPVFANAGTIGELNMTDNSRTISNSTLQNSSANLGDNSTVSNSLQQLPDSQGELKAVLLQLVALLEKAQVAEQDKQSVRQEIQNLAEIAVKPAEERKSTDSKVITTLKDLTSIFKDLPEVYDKYGELLSKLSEMFI